MAKLGDKVSCKQLAIANKVPTSPGSKGAIEDEKTGLKIAREIGYPVMIKAAAGGGGRGMRVAHNDGALVSGINAGLQPKPRPRSATAPSTSRSSSTTPATSRSRSSATSTATSSTSGNATAPCSAASRSSSRKRPAPSSNPRRTQGPLHRRRTDVQGRRLPHRRAPSSS